MDVQLRLTKYPKRVVLNYSERRYMHTKNSSNVTVCVLHF